MEQIDQHHLVAPTGAAGAIVRGCYRYLLWREWDANRSRLLWILLNPSLADAATEDPTLGRCVAFSRLWGYGGLEIVNLFAYRSPYPSDLLHAADPVGPENDQFISDAAQRASGVLLAWGQRGRYLQRDRAVLALFAGQQMLAPQCLGLTKVGCPRHPLYVKSTTPPTPLPQAGT